MMSAAVPWTRLSPDFGKLTVDWLLSGVLVRLFHERSEMKPDALKQMRMALVALRSWQQSSARQLLLQLRYLADAATEMLLGDVAAEWQIRESGLRYTFALGRRQGDAMPAPRHALRAGNEEGIDFSFTC